jgi:hypothetical protein
MTLAREPPHGEQTPVLQQIRTETGAQRHKVGLLDPAARTQKALEHSVELLDHPQSGRGDSRATARSRPEHTARVQAEDERI